MSLSQTRPRQANTTEQLTNSSLLSLKWLGGLFTFTSYGRQSRTERTYKRTAFRDRRKRIASLATNGMQVFRAIEDLPSKTLQVVQSPKTPVSEMH